MHCTVHSDLTATPQLHVANHGYEYGRRFGLLLCGTWWVDLGRGMSISTLHTSTTIRI
jgi:hypothetical protein